MLPTVTFSVGDSIVYRWFGRYYSAEIVGFGDHAYPTATGVGATGARMDKLVRLVKHDGERMVFDALTLAEAMMDATE